MSTRPLATRTIIHTWWPLAASWLLMGVEIPMISAVVTRLPGGEIHLAAFGGLVFPIALLIESPIIMMLAASTALATDYESFIRLRRYTTTMAIALTLVQTAVAFTPLFDIVARDIIDAPVETIEPARTGLRILTLWTWAIADRRFHQGVLIRFGRQNLVGVGTIIRLVGTWIPLGIGIWLHDSYQDSATDPGLQSVSGIVVATGGMAVGVLFEAIYARWCTRSIVRAELREAPPPAEPLNIRRFCLLYFPLAMTPLIALLSQPIGAAGLARMPDPMESLAVWPVLNGLSFMLRSSGVAFNEVVVRHAGDPSGRRVLGRFAWVVGGGFSLLTAVIALTPLSWLWFGEASGLTPDLAELARDGLLWSMPFALITFLHSYYQGLLVHAHRSRGITEAVAIFTVVMSAVLTFGILRPTGLSGCSFTYVAMGTGAVAQALWLAYRWHQVRSTIDSP